MMKIDKLIKKEKIHAEIPLKKIWQMQKIHLERYKSYYSQEQINKINKFYSVINYKYHLLNLNLEHLWSLSEIKRDKIFYAIENSLLKLDVSDDELIKISYVFENFLFQSRAFLDFYMIYILFVLNSNYIGKLTISNFKKSLKKIKEEPFKSKAEFVSNYFKENVFGETSDNSIFINNWGTLIKSLRDKVAHKDKLNYSFDSEETLHKDILFNWPTLRKITYDRFCENIATGIFRLFTDISPILFNLEWKSGPYSENLWSEITDEI